MLAQNFKTPADLGLTDAQFDGLFKTLRMLEREEVSHAPFQTDFRGMLTGLGGRKPSHFNMYHFYAAVECGTACCICGWAEYLGNLEPRSLLEGRIRNPQLNNLFDPSRANAGDFSGRLNSITVAQAAVALRNYLTHGEPRWDEALA